MDDVGDYVVDIKQAPAPPQLREGQVVAAVASAAHIAPLAPDEQAPPIES